MAEPWQDISWCQRTAPETLRRRATDTFSSPSTGLRTCGIIVVDRALNAFGSMEGSSSGIAWRGSVPSCRTQVKTPPRRCPPNAPPHARAWSAFPLVNTRERVQRTRAHRIIAYCALAHPLCIAAIYGERRLPSLSPAPTSPPSAVAPSSWTGCPTSPAYRRNLQTDRVMREIINGVPSQASTLGAV